MSQHAPSTTLRSLRELRAVPLPRYASLRGGGYARSFSRRDFAPELCHAIPTNHSAERDRVTPEPAVGPTFGSITLR
jgi:hypothetical protein